MNIQFKIVAMNQPDLALIQARLSEMRGNPLSPYWAYRAVFRASLTYGSPTGILARVGRFAFDMVGAYALRGISQAFEKIGVPINIILLLEQANDLVKMGGVVGLALVERRLTNAIASWDRLSPSVRSQVSMAMCALIDETSHLILGGVNQVYGTAELSTTTTYLAKTAISAGIAAKEASKSHESNILGLYSAYNATMAFFSWLHPRWFIEPSAILPKPEPRSFEEVSSLAREFEVSDYGGGLGYPSNRFPEGFGNPEAMGVQKLLERLYHVYYSTKTPISVSSLRSKLNEISDVPFSTFSYPLQDVLNEHPRFVDPFVQDMLAILRLAPNTADHSALTDAFRSWCRDNLG